MNELLFDAGDALADTLEVISALVLVVPEDQRTKEMEDQISQTIIKAVTVMQKIALYLGPAQGDMEGYKNLLAAGESVIKQFRELGVDAL